MISQTRCKRLLAGDGITTPEFTINAFPAVFEGLSVDARSAKKEQPVFAQVFSIAKNLDEYQHKICVTVMSLTDSPTKVVLQKYRIAILAAFVKLVSAIREEQGSLPSWMDHAHSLLVEASDAYAASTIRGATLQKSKVGEALAFFGVREEDVDRSLAAAYYP